jgi:hypothetical protein
MKRLASVTTKLLDIYCSEVEMKKGGTIAMIFRHIIYCFGIGGQIDSWIT